jgi:hypothetical protein
MLRAVRLDDDEPKDAGLFGPGGPRRDRRAPLVRLLEEDPGIAGALSGDALAAARHRVLAPCVHVEPKAWTPDPRLRGAMAVVVLQGKLVSVRGTGGAWDAALVGSGDVLGARRIDTDLRWQAVEPARLAVIDARFLLAARVWPQLVAAVIDRTFESATAQRALAAVGKLPRIDQRLLAFMSLLVRRWGAPEPDGSAVSLPVTHQILGLLVGARRPTVTLALSELDRQGLLRRRNDGRWWMPTRAIAASAAADVPRLAQGPAPVAVAAR